MIRPTGPLFWERCNHARTSKSSKFRELLIYKFVTISVPKATTSRDAVEQIAREVGIPIESLSRDLLQKTFSRGRVVFGYAGDELDQIARDYDGMQWWVSDNGLNMAIVTAMTPPHVPSFEEWNIGTGEESLAGAIVGSPSRTKKNTGGRPKALKLLKKNVIRKVRGSEKQEAFALACRIGKGTSISVDTLQHAEKANLATMRTLRRICQHPKAKAKNLKPEDLLETVPEKPEK